MRGTAQVLRFNWPFYAVAGAAIVSGWALAMFALPPWRWLGAVVVAVAGWFALASLVGTWWAYDAGGVYRFAWLARRIGTVSRWCTVHAGLDEATPCLVPLLGGEHRVFDIHRDSATEPSLARARAGGAATGEVIGAAPLPLSDGWAEAVVLAFAAHELRAHSERVALFRDLARVLAPDGRIWLVEHCRDAANTLAYGPGAWHFHPRSAWLRAISESGLHLVAAERMNPFVWCFEVDQRRR